MTTFNPAIDQFKQCMENSSAKCKNFQKKIFFCSNHQFYHITHTNISIEIRFSAVNMLHLETTHSVCLSAPYQAGLMRKRIIDCAQDHRHSASHSGEH